MGFGFNLFVAFILFPLTGILLFVWLLTRRQIFGNAIGLLWGGLFILVFCSAFIQWFTTKIELKKKDYYGQYIVDRDYFPGKQADWQYNNFRFEIMENDSIYFYVTDKANILKTFKGKIATTKHNSERLLMYIDQPNHHILASDPTTYRGMWSFYLVFESAKFNNVFFKKGKWKPI